MHRILLTLLVGFLTGHGTASADLTHDEIIRCSRPIDDDSYDSFSVFVDSVTLARDCFQPPHHTDGACSVSGMLVHTAGDFRGSRPRYRGRGSLTPGRVDLTWVDPDHPYLTLTALQFSQEPREGQFPWGLAATFTQAPSILTFREGWTNELLCHRMDQLADGDEDGVVDLDDPCPGVVPGNHPDPTRRGCPLLDTDGDGVFDTEDLCPIVPQGEHPDPARRGCPLPE